MRCKPLGSWLQRIPGAKTSVKAQIDAIAARALAAHFEERYPGYPLLAEITKHNLDGTGAGRDLTNRYAPPTALGTKVLTSLGSIDMNGQIVTDGEFAKALLGAARRRRREGAQPCRNARPSGTPAC